MEIAIIGFGDFGKFMAKHLSQKAKVFVTDIKNIKKEAEELGLTFVSLDESLSKKIIILAVPMQNLESVLERIKDRISPGTLVLDACSLKIFSSDLMKRILPKTVRIIGTHPLFGPNSGKNGIHGMKIALVPVRTPRKKLNDVKKFCESFGLKVFVTTPKEHDRQMAISQALTHFIAKALKNLRIKIPDMSTRTWDLLQEAVNFVGNDSELLFRNLETMNPFAKGMRESFLFELNNINKKLG